MKSASSPMISHIGQEVTTLADCIKITRKDAQVFAYTSFDQDLSISNNDSPETLTTYKAAGSYVPTALKSDAALSVPNQEIDAAIASDDITYQDLLAEKFDGALVERFLVNWADLTMGKIILPGYKFGQLTPKDFYFTVELRGLTDLLRARTGEVCQPYCRVDLFSPQCGLNANNYKQSGVVTATDGKKTIVVSGITDSIYPLITENLTVSPKASPWQFTGGINSSFDFGDHSGNAPTIAATALTAGWKVGVYFRSGWVKISDSERPHVDASGQSNDISGDTLGSTGNYFPTHYASTGKATLGKGGLITAFTDGSGNVIEVHADGNSGYYTVPVGATRPQFGINDDKLSDNLGDGFQIVVQIDRGMNIGTPDFSQFNQGGRIAFTSGNNNGYTAEVKIGDTGTSELQLYLKTPSPIQVGDTFDIWPSCDKLPSTCINKYRNILNFRGFKYLPGIDAARVTQLVKLP